MGIRFNCPNGHGLHVKEFLAGKRGICPKCGVRVKIPSQGGVGGGADGAGDGTGAPKSQQAGPAVDAQRSPTNQEPKGEPAGEPEPTGGNPTVKKLDVTAPPQSNGSPAAWYVRIASGEQYGPAEERLFRSWIEQGRVGQSCLVWREGWENWRDATEVLQELEAEPPLPTTPPPAASQNQLAANNVVGVGSTPQPQHIDPVAPPSPGGIQIETNRPIPTTRNKSQLLVLLLFAVCLLLLVPLVSVFLSTR